MAVVVEVTVVEVGGGRHLAPQERLRPKSLMETFQGRLSLFLVAPVDVDGTAGPTVGGRPAASDRTGGPAGLSHERDVD